MTACMEGDGKCVRGREEKRPFDLQTNVLANGLAMRELECKPATDLSRGLQQVVHEHLNCG